MVVGGQPAAKPAGAKRIPGPGLDTIRTRMMNLKPVNEQKEKLAGGGDAGQQGQVGNVSEPAKHQPATPPSTVPARGRQEARVSPQVRINDDHDHPGAPRVSSALSTCRVYQLENKQMHMKTNTAFSALTLLVRRQEKHPTSKN